MVDSRWSGLPKRLRDSRAKTGWTQAQLAVKADVGSRTVPSYETEVPPRGPDPKVIEKLAAVLSVDPMWLMYGDAVASRIEQVDTHPVIEAFIVEQRLEPELAEDLRRHAHAAGGRFVRDELLMLLPAIRMRAARLRAEAAGEPDPAPRELPPVPEGRRRVPPGKKGRGGRVTNE